jgi:hypothetical protein
MQTTAGIKCSNVSIVFGPHGQTKTILKSTPEMQWDEFQR